MTKAPKRHQDRERVARTKLDALPAGLWRMVRAGYPAKTRAVVDVMVARGSLALADVRDIELARALTLMDMADKAGVRYERERQRMDRVARGKPKPGESAVPDYTAPGLNALGSLDSVALQSRKHLRTILLAMGPALTANDMPVAVPEGFDLEGMQRIVDGLEPDEILS